MDGQMLRWNRAVPSTTLPSMFKPYRLQGEAGAVQTAPDAPEGRRMGPTSPNTTVNDPQSWKPGQDQNTASMRGQQKPRAPAVRPPLGFRVG